MRFYLIAKFSGITKIYHYPLFKKTKQHITNTPKDFLKNELNLEVNEDPEIHIDNISVSKSIKKFNINKDEINILLGIGGSGPTKRIPANIYLSVIEKLLKLKNVSFFLQVEWTLRSKLS